MRNKGGKVLCALVALLYCAALLAVPAMAADSISVEIDGVPLVTDVQARLSDSRPMVPMRAVFEALGARVFWDADTRTVTAEAGETLATLQIGSASMIVDGEAVELDAPPRIESGRTLVTIPAVLACFDVDARWDEAAKTVRITTGELTPDTVTVSTVDEFVGAVRSNRTILLKEGVYDFTKYNGTYAGGFSVDFIDRLTILGEEGRTVEFVNADRFCEILTFNSCEGIRVANIKAGHTPQEYECDAGVFVFDGCSEVSVEGCYLYGCGSQGIAMWSCTGVSVKDTTITDCSLRAAYVWDSKDIFFVGVKMSGNRGLDVANVVYSENVLFDGCTVEDNKQIEWSVFEAYYSKDVRIDNCVIRNNSVSDSPLDNACIFLCEESALAVSNTTVTGNKINYEKIGDVTYTNCTISDNTFFAELPA